MFKLVVKKEATKMSVYKEFVKTFLPKGILEYFKLVDFKEERGQLRIYLEELDLIPEEYKDLHYRSNGFLEEIKVKDFPIRELFVTLHIKRRRWLLVKSKEKITRSWALVKPGTRITSEFSGFLKELA
jgi:hypothetical protein